jgi:hypothetical protein
MKKSDAPAAKAESKEFEFPDFTGMDDTSQRVTPDTAFQLCEQYPAWFPDQVKRWRAQRPEKCVVEFTL